METTYLMSTAISSVSNRKKNFISLMYFLSYRALKMARQEKAKT